MYNSCILGRYPGKLRNSPKWLMPSPYIPFSSKDKTRVDVYEFAPDYWETNSVVPSQCKYFTGELDNVTKNTMSGIHEYFYFFQITLSANHILHLVKNSTSKSGISPFYNLFSFSQ